MGWKLLDKHFYTVLNTSLKSKNKNKFELWILYFKRIYPGFSNLPFAYHPIFRDIKSDLCKHYIKRETLFWWMSPTYTVSVDISSLKRILDTRVSLTIKCNFQTNIATHGYFFSEDKTLLTTPAKSNIADYMNIDNGFSMIQVPDTQSAISLETLTLSDSNSNKSSSGKKNTVFSFFESKSNLLNFFAL
jgi:hypothetical protein